MNSREYQESDVAVPRYFKSMNSALQIYRHQGQTKELGMQALEEETSLAKIPKLHLGICSMAGP